MNNRKLIRSIIVSVVILMLSLTAMACGKTEGDEIGPFYAEYGQVFVVPDLGGETIIRDSDGNTVHVEDGRFYVDSTNDYDIEVKISGKVYKGKIIVNFTSVPVIESSFEIGYGQVNTEVTLPSIKAYVGGTEISYTAVMSKGETTVDVSDGFRPDATGEYVYTVTAVSGEKKTEKAITIYVEETDSYKNKIASFDKPYGVKHIRKDYGISAKYTTERSYNGEAGSTEITINTAEAEHEAMFALGNFHIKDWTQIAGIKMYIYNDNNMPVSFMLNWSTGTTTLMPGVWTQFYVGADMLQKLHATTGTEALTMFYLDSADGIFAEILAPVTGKGSFSLYFSGLYAGEKDIVSAAALNDMIAEFVALEDVDYELKESIENAYRALPDNQKNEVVGYEGFVAKVKAFIAADSEETEETDVIIHTDRPFGRYQLRVSDCFVDYSSGIRYGDESGSTMIQPYNFYGGIEIAYPVFTDITRVEYIEFYIYNANPKDYAVQLIRNDQVQLPAQEWTKVSIDVLEFTNIEQVNFLAQIYTGNWSQGMEKDGAKFYLSSVRVVGAAIQTGEDLYNYIEELTDLTDDKVASVKRFYKLLSSTEQAKVTNYKSFLKTYYTTRDDVDTDAEHRINYFDSEYGIEQVNSAATLGYSTMSPTGYDGGSIKASGNGSTWVMGFKFTEFEGKFADKEYVKENYSYVEFYVYNGSVGGDAYRKSIYISVTAGGFLKSGDRIELPIDTWTKVRLPIPADGDLSNAAGNGWAFVLEHGNASNNGLDNANYTVYISAVYGVPKVKYTSGDDMKAALDELMQKVDEISDLDVLNIKDGYSSLSSTEQAKVTNYKSFLKTYYTTRDDVDTDAEHRINYFDSEYGIEQVNSAATLGYSTMSPTGYDGGSIKASGNGSTWVMGFKFTEFEGKFADKEYVKENYSYVEFYVYNGSVGGDAYRKSIYISVTAGGFLKSGDRIELPIDTWTKVRLPIPADGDLSNAAGNGWAFVLEHGNASNNGLDNANYTVYISAVYGVPKES